MRTSGGGWPGRDPTYLPPCDFQVLLQEIHGVWGGHIAWSLVVLPCQGQNKPEDPSTDQGLATGLPAKVAALAGALTQPLTRLMELKGLPAQLFQQRQGLTNGLTYSEETTNLSSGYSCCTQHRVTTSLSPFSTKSLAVLRSGSSDRAFTT